LLRRKYRPLNEASPWYANTGARRPTDRVRRNRETEDASDDSEHPDDRRGGVILRPPVDQLLYVYTCYAGDGLGAEDGNDVVVEDALIAQLARTPFHRVGLQPPRRQFREGDLARCGIEPRSARNVRLGSGQPGLGVCLGCEGFQRDMAGPGVPITGLIAA
jgi:hypothetical protein